MRQRFSSDLKFELVTLSWVFQGWVWKSFFLQCTDHKQCTWKTQAIHCVQYTSAELLLLPMFSLKSKVSTITLPIPYHQWFHLLDEITGFFQNLKSKLINCFSLIHQNGLSLFNLCVMLFLEDAVNPDSDSTGSWDGSAVEQLHGLVNPEQAYCHCCCTFYWSRKTSHACGQKSFF